MLSSRYVFYTFTPIEPDTKCACEAENGYGFFGTLEEVRSAVLALRCEIDAEEGEQWTPVYIQKVYTLPLTKDNIMSLLNHGTESFVVDHINLEIIA